MSDIKTICGLWVKATKKDPNKKYMSGLDIRAIQALDPDQWRLMIFKNNRKRNDKDPDYQVMAMPNDPKFQKKAEYKPEQEKPKYPERPVYKDHTKPSYPTSQPAFGPEDPGPSDDLPF